MSIISYLAALDGNWMVLANDISMPRVVRLKQNIDQIFPDIERRHIKITNGDATQNNQNLKKYMPFNKILVDAPCSCDSFHVMEDPSMSSWSEAKMRKNSHRQKKLLETSLEMLSNTGELLYCTCSILNGENDEVVEYVLNKAKFKNKFTISDDFTLVINCDYNVVDLHDTIDKSQKKLVLRRTKFGFLILPCDNHGSGPLYFSKFIRV